MATKQADAYLRFLLGGRSQTEGSRLTVHGLEACLRKMSSNYAFRLDLRALLYSRATNGYTQHQQ